MIKNMFSNKFFSLFSLFLLGGVLHYVVFQFVQNVQFTPDNLKIFYKDLHFVFLMILIGSEITGALINQVIARKIGLEKTLILGFSLNLLGLLILLFTHLNKEFILINYAALFLKTIVIGIALTLVLSTIISYIVFVMPKKIGSGILIYFAFGNIGAFLIFPFLLDITMLHNLQWFSIYFLIALVIFSIFIIKKIFINPPFPKHLEKLRKGSLIWKELHYRLALFLVAIILFSLCESTFSKWGKIYFVKYFSEKLSDTIISLFWFFVIISQIVLCFLILFLDIRKTFYFLSMMIAFSLLFLSFNIALANIIIVLAIGGIGCSGTFAIILGNLEKELIYLTKKSHHLAFLPYVEMTVAWMLAAYFLGDGIIAFQIEKMDIATIDIFKYFKMGSVFAFIMIFILSFLFYTSPYNKKIRNF
ncbi:MAG: hypothetical protein AMS24_01950 [Chlamydiae bacterium SM23_39]|nr:MAG: hypothetical protein AMS24_01950 [Chlamydiae bacterium SM23_39]